ncbi:MAG TPA: hypothetical protein VF789_08970 [Thermoanaerobaculia bacterium]
MRAVFRVLPLVLLLAAAFPALGAAQSCAATDTRLCLQGGRFQVEVDWTVPGLGSGPGHAVPLTSDTGTFWFFSNSNVELVIKVLDGQTVNGNFWVYYGGLSDVAYRITVTDTRTTMKRTYENPPGKLVSRADTEAFKAEPPAPLIAEALAIEPDSPVDPSLPPSPLLRQGPEIPVNLTTPYFQQQSSVAIGADGGFLVVWVDNGLIRGRWFDAAGHPRTGEVTINAGNAAWSPRVAASPTGGFMVVWTEADDLFARVYGADDQSLGAPFRIGSDANGSQSSPAVVTNAAGGFLVAWKDAGNTRTRRFSAQGDPLGQEAAFERTESAFRLAASPAGGYALAWTVANGFLQTDVRARRLDALGQPAGQPFAVSTNGFSRLPGYHDHPVPVFHADGGFSIVWTTYAYVGTIPDNVQGLYARRYGADGQPAGDAVQLQFSSGPSVTPPSAALLPSGDVLVVWHQWAIPEDPDGGLFGQIFDGAWKPRSAAARINTFTADEQIEPAVAVSGQGDVVATWTSGRGELPILPPSGYGEGTQDGHYYGVFGQRFALATASCATATTQLCLGGRFRVEVRFTDPRNGQPGDAHAIPLTSDTGAFWFFNAENVELVLKVLDGRTVNGHFWVYQGALSDVAYTITVEDTETGETKTYENAPGRLVSRADVEAFPLP